MNRLSEACYKLAVSNALLSTYLLVCEPSLTEKCQIPVRTSSWLSTFATRLPTSCKPAAVALLPSNSSFFLNPLKMESPCVNAYTSARWFQSLLNLFPSLCNSDSFCKYLLINETCLSRDVKRDRIIFVETRVIQTFREKWKFYILPLLLTSTKWRRCF